MVAGSGKVPLNCKLLKKWQDYISGRAKLSLSVERDVFALVQNTKQMLQMP
jgi:hypothetical protein